MTTEPLSLGEMWARAPISFVMVHVGAIATGYWLARLANRVERRFKKRRRRS